MQPIGFSVLYQDHHLLLINKQAGIVIHPTYKHADDTLWNYLLAYLEEQKRCHPLFWQPPVLPDEPAWVLAPTQIREMLRQHRTDKLWQEEGPLPHPSLLHRLDKDTSGIVALACTARARTHIVRQFEARTIVKRYLAVVQRGAPDWTVPRTTMLLSRQSPQNQFHSVDLADFFPLLNTDLGADSLLLDGPLERDPADRRRCVVIVNGQEARTLVKPLACENGFVLLDVRPITGRTHQIRAHLAAAGCAIVGDPVYAESRPQAEPALARQFLHANTLTLRLYPDNALQTFTAPLSADLLSWLASHMPNTIK
jgi:23S rRNA-/tRNA-specific pseudouridylate synthase